MLVMPPPPNLKPAARNCPSHAIRFLTHPLSWQANQLLLSSSTYYVVGRYRHSTYLTDIFLFPLYYYPRCLPTEVDTYLGGRQVGVSASPPSEDISSVERAWSLTLPTEKDGNAKDIGFEKLFGESHSMVRGPNWKRAYPRYPPSQADSALSRMEKERASSACPRTKCTHDSLAEATMSKGVLGVGGTCMPAASYWTDSKKAEIRCYHLPSLTQGGGHPPPLTRLPAGRLRHGAQVAPVQRSESSHSPCPRLRSCRYGPGFCRPLPERNRTPTSNPLSVLQCSIGQVLIGTI